MGDPGAPTGDTLCTYGDLKDEYNELFYSLFKNRRGILIAAGLTHDMSVPLLCYFF